MPLTPEEQIAQLRSALDEAKTGFDGQGKRISAIEEKLAAAEKAKADAEEAAKKAAEAKPAKKPWGWW